MNFDGLLSATDWLLGVIFPEWRAAGLPVYMVPFSRLPEQIRPAEAEAVTSGILDLVLEEFIPQWRGRGPCFAFDDRLYADLSYDAARRRLGAVAIHEACHIAERSQPCLPVRDVAPEVRAYFVAEERAALAAVLTNPTTADQEWAGQHRWRFVRLLVHALHRVERTGYPVDTERALNVGYPLSSLARYERSLSGELFSTTPLTELCRTPPPLEFIALWCHNRRLTPTADQIDQLIATSLERTVPNG